MYGGDGVEYDGAVTRQHLELLLRHDVPEVEQCQLHLSHVDVQVTEGILVEGGRVGATGRAFVPRCTRRGGRGSPCSCPATATATAATGRTHVGELLQEVLLEGARTTR